MQCRYCGAVNGPSNKTCVLCGKTIGMPVVAKAPEPEPETHVEEPPPVVSRPPRELNPEEHIRIGELIYSAYKHKEAGALEDAIVACQGALALNEASAPAQLLLGSLYESNGDIPSAIYQYEKVKLLDPGNVANLQKLASLRKLPSNTMSSDSSSSKRKFPISIDRLMPYVPYASAVAVFLALLIGGLLLTNNKNQTRPVDEGSRFIQPKTGIPQTTTPVQPGYSDRQSDQANQQPYLGPGQVQPAQGQNQPTAADQANSRDQQRTGPVQIPVPKSGVATGARAATSLPSGMQPAAPKPAPAPTPMIMPIIEQLKPTVRQSNPPIPAPAPKPQPKPAPAPQAADPEAQAMQYQGAGKYQEAISSYREALSRTSDSGRIHQQIALCYQRLGQKDQAVSSYKSAIRSYRDQLAAGRDASEVQRNIRSCEAGIEAASPGR